MAVESVNQDIMVGHVASALRANFGGRADAVAERQVEAASGGALETWRAILAMLRADRDRRE